MEFIIYNPIYFTKWKEPNWFVILHFSVNKLQIYKAFLTLVCMWEWWCCSVNESNGMLNMVIDSNKDKDYEIWTMNLTVSLVVNNAWESTHLEFVQSLDASVLFSIVN